MCDFLLRWNLGSKRVKTPLPALVRVWSFTHFFFLLRFLLLFLRLFVRLFLAFTFRLLSLSFRLRFGLGFAFLQWGNQKPSLSLRRIRFPWLIERIFLSFIRGGEGGKLWCWYDFRTVTSSSGFRPVNLYICLHDISHTVPKWNSYRYYKGLCMRYNFFHVVPEWKSYLYENIHVYTYPKTPDGSKHQNAA